MARMNMFCNGVRIDSIEDLWDNFNFEDMKRNISTGRLQQWLSLNGFSAEECDLIKDIDCNATDADIQFMRALKYPDEKQQAYLTAKNHQQVCQQLKIKIRNILLDYLMARSHWSVCQLPEKFEGKICANVQMIFESDLESTELISGETETPLAFFFDGYFWMKITFESSFNVVWLKSSDGINWEIDTELCKIQEVDSIFMDLWGQEIKVCDKYVFRIPRKDSLSQYSSESGWSSSKFKFSDVHEDVSIEDVYAENNYVGFVCRYQTESNSTKYEIYSRSNFLDKSESFSLIYSEDRESGNFFVNAFNGYLFVLSGEHFLYAKLGQEQLDFKNVELPGYLNVSLMSFLQKIRVFKNAMFIVNGDLIFTTDGLKWKECAFDSDNFIDIVDVAFTGKYYVAIAKEGIGKSTIYYSETGAVWKKFQTFLFSCDDAFQKFMTAGNDKILIYNGSTLRKYILINATSFND